MSNNKFTVDAVPTPRINLAGAFESDLGYYMKNGNRLPPLGKSQLKQLEEQLNDYLKFLNESFILKGFTKGALTVSVINAGLIQDKEGKFVIDLDNSTWVLYDEKKENVLFSYSPQTGLMLSGKLFADEGTIGGFTIGKEGLTAGGSAANKLLLATNQDAPYFQLGNLYIWYQGNRPRIEATTGVLEVGAWDKLEMYVREQIAMQLWLDTTGREDVVQADIYGNLDVRGKLTVNGNPVGAGGMSQIGSGYTTGSNVRMRAYPSTSAPETYQIYSSYSDVSIYGRGVDASGYTWYYCRYDEDYIGWIREDLLSVVMG